MFSAVFGHFKSYAEPNAGYNRVVYWDLSSVDSPSSATLYDHVRHDIRRQVSVEFRNGVWSISGNRNPSEYIAISLRGGSSADSVSVLMRSSDMYVVGYTISDRTYLTDEADGASFNNVHQLNHSADYSTLLARANIDSLDRIPLGISSLDVVTHNLIRDEQNPSSNFMRTSARFLLTTALMLGEGARFEPSIGRGISQAISQGDVYNFSLGDQELIRNWGSLSNWGRRITQDPGTGPYMNPGHIAWTNSQGEYGAHNLHTFNDLTLLLGILAIDKGFD